MCVWGGEREREREREEEEEEEEEGEKAEEKEEEKLKICKCFHLQASRGCYINIYEQEAHFCFRIEH